METVLDAGLIAHALTDKPKRSGESWRVPCPAHGGEGPNLSLRNGDGGRLLTFCPVTDILPSIFVPFLYRLRARIPQKPRVC